MLVINDFSPFVDMTEGEFFDYFKDKCSQGTPIKKIYQDEKKKYERLNNMEEQGPNRDKPTKRVRLEEVANNIKDVGVNKTVNKKRKKTKSESTDS